MFGNGKTKEDFNLDKNLVWFFDEDISFGPCFLDDVQQDTSVSDVQNLISDQQDTNVSKSQFEQYQNPILTLDLLSNQMVTQTEHQHEDQNEENFNDAFDIILNMDKNDTIALQPSISSLQLPTYQESSLQCSTSKCDFVDVQDVQQNTVTLEACKQNTNTLRICPQIEIDDDLNLQDLVKRSMKLSDSNVLTIYSRLNGKKNKIKLCIDSSFYYHDLHLCLVNFVIEHNLKSQSIIVFFSQKTNRSYKSLKGSTSIKKKIKCLDQMLSIVPKGCDTTLNTNISFSFHDYYYTCIENFDTISIPKKNINMYYFFKNYKNKPFCDFMLLMLRNCYFNSELYKFKKNPHILFYKHLEPINVNYNFYYKVLFLDIDFDIELSTKSAYCISVKNIPKALSDVYQIATHGNVTIEEKDQKLTRRFHVLDKNLNLTYLDNFNVMDIIKESFPDICFDNQYSQKDFEFHSRLLVYAQDRSLHPNCGIDQPFVIRYDENKSILDLYNRIKDIDFFVKEDLSKKFTLNAHLYYQAAVKACIQDKETQKIISSQNFYMVFFSMIVSVLRVLSLKIPKGKVIVLNLGTKISSALEQAFILSMLSDICFGTSARTINILSAYPLLESNCGANFTFIPIWYPCNYPLVYKQLSDPNLIVNTRHVSDDFFYKQCQQFFQQKDIISYLREILEKDYSDCIAKI
ncbi:hypothetical protein AB837_00271 [bacterium AB1]|nr:hypothetical protein AB837_00271 [bacterium AB1]